MAKNKSLVKDERLVEIIRKICTWLYFATLVMILIDLFYRQFVLKQNISQFEDLAIIITANTLLFVASLFYYGVLTPLKIKLKVKNLVLLYIAFLGVGTVFNAFKYGVKDMKLFLDKFIISAAICAILVFVWGIIGYFGQRKIEKDIAQE